MLVLMFVACPTQGDTASTPNQDVVVALRLEKIDRLERELAATKLERDIAFAAANFLAVDSPRGKKFVEGRKSLTICMNDRTPDGAWDVWDESMLGNVIGVGHNSFTFPTVETECLGGDLTHATLTLDIPIAQSADGVRWEIQQPVMLQNSTIALKDVDLR